MKLVFLLLSVQVIPPNYRSICKTSAQSMLKMTSVMAPTLSLCTRICPQAHQLGTCLAKMAGLTASVTHFWDLQFLQSRKSSSQHGRKSFFSYFLDTPHLPWTRAQAKLIGRSMEIKYFLVCDQNNEKLKYLTEPFFLSHWFPMWGEL